MADRTYRLHWRNGKTQDVRGPDAASAMNNAGIGFGAIRALDYYEEIASEPGDLDISRQSTAAVWGRRMAEVGRIKCSCGTSTAVHDDTCLRLIAARELKVCYAIEGQVTTLILGQSDLPRYSNDA